MSHQDDHFIIRHNYRDRLILMKTSKERPVASEAMLPTI
jgi:hypothetical protein